MRPLKIIIAIYRLSSKIIMLEDDMMVISATYVRANTMSTNLTSTTRTRRNIIIHAQSTINSKVREWVDHWKALPTINKWCHLRSRRGQKWRGYQGKIRTAVAQWNRITVGKWALNLQSGQRRSISQYSACLASKMQSSRNLTQCSLQAWEHLNSRLWAKASRSHCMPIRSAPGRRSHLISWIWTIRSMPRPTSLWRAGRTKANW